MSDDAAGGWLGGASTVTRRQMRLALTARGAVLKAILPEL
jgi:hypothetical protein